MSLHERITKEQFNKMNQQQRGEYLLMMSLLNIGDTAQTIYRQGGRKDSIMGRVSESAYAEFREMKSAKGGYNHIFQDVIETQENEIGNVISYSLEEYINRASGKFNEQGLSIANGEVVDQEILEWWVYEFKEVLAEIDKNSTTQGL